MNLQKHTQSVFYLFINFLLHVITYTADKKLNIANIENNLKHACKKCLCNELQMCYVKNYFSWL